VSARLDFPCCFVLTITHLDHKKLTELLAMCSLTTTGCNLHDYLASNCTTATNFVRRKVRIT